MEKQKNQMIKMKELLQVNQEKLKKYEMSGNPQAMINEFDLLQKRLAHMEEQARQREREAW